MKNKDKILIAISSILMIVILVLIFTVLLDDENDKSNKETTTSDIVNSDGNNEESDENKASEEEVASTEETTEKTTEKDSSLSNDEKEKSYKISLKMSKTNEWEANGKFYAQFDIKINNKTNDKITNWKVAFPVSDKTKMDNIWNGKDKTEDGKMIISSADYNKEIEPKGNLADVGFIIYSNDKEELNNLAKKAILLIDDKEYKELDDGDTANITESNEDKTTENGDKEEKTDNNKKSEEKNDSDAKLSENKALETPFEVHGKLKVDGTDIVDKNGDKFQLKGLSTHGIAWFPDYVNLEAFKTFRDDWGANLIRLAMYTDENMGYCSGGDKAKTKELVESGVDYATELGMYVIVDWHVLHDLDPNLYIDEAKVFFEEISQKYSDQDNVIYEICNEPNGGTTWEDVKQYANEIIPIIRKNCPDAIIIVGTPTWSQDVDVASKSPLEGYSNIMYAIHFYAATHTDNIRAKVDEARKNGLPVFVSEFSICDASGNGAIDYDQALKWFELINNYNLSYAAWNISNKDETSSIIQPSCDKKSGWTIDELSDTGKWIREQIKK